MPIVQASNDIRVFVDEDHELKDVAEDFLGRKAYSLFGLKHMDVPVPPFFVLSGSVFTEYISRSVSDSSDGNISDEDVRDKILKGQFPEETQQDIIRAYSRLSGFSESWVSVRSSIVLPHTHRALTCAGILETILNVKGVEDLETSIKKVYASAFTPKTADYLARHNISIADIKVAIVVQKMVQSEAAGVVFTVDPISQNDNYLTIEAVFGLGDVIANGDITPDQYIIDKGSLEFIEKRIVPQNWMMVRKISRSPEGGGDHKVKISKAWQNQQKLENRYVKELSRIAILVEKKARSPQDIEWVFEGGRIWLLQSTDAIPLKIPDSIADIPIKMDSSIVTAAQVIAEREAAKQAVKEELRKKKASMKKDAEEKAVQKAAKEEEKKREVFTAKPFSRQVVKGTSSVKEKPVSHISPLPGEKLLLTGIGASGTTTRGNVLIISGEDQIEPNKKKLTGDTVLVMPEHITALDRYIPKVTAVVVDTGGATSDIATMCRERGLPCVMGSYIASKMLNNGESVLVDGTIGAIYGKREYQAPPEPPKKVLKQSKREKKPAKKSATSKEKRSTTAASKKIETFPKERVLTATKIYSDLSDSILRGESWKEQITYSDGVAVVQIEDLYKKIGRHPEAYIEEGKKDELLQRLSGYISEICDIVEDKPVIVSIGSMTVSDYRSLTRGAEFENLKDDALNESSSGLVRLLKHQEELGLVLKTIRRVRNVDGWRTVSLAIEHAGTPTLLSDFKKHLSSAGLRRSSTFNVFLHVSTSSEVVIMDDFVKAGIDGVIVDVGKLATSMMAPGPEDSSIKKMLESLKTGTRELRSILQVPSDADSLIKTAVDLGFTGISVTPSETGNFRSVISEHERAAIFKR
jgi:phosphoenolpyruvate synthase/pyruvate phosphate dikinase